MKPEIKTWLFDISNAIKEIEIFIESTLDFSSFQNDLKTKRAVERNIEIIGEAMSRIINTDDSIELSNTRRLLIPGIALYMVTIPFQMISSGISHATSSPA